MKKTLIALTLAATAAASMATAGINTFELGNKIDNTTYADLGMVRAVADGVVEISDMQGNLLGATPVKAGVTGNVRVEFGTNIHNKVLAELKINGQTVAAQFYDVNND